MDCLIHIQGKPVKLIPIVVKGAKRKKDQEREGSENEKLEYWWHWESDDDFQPDLYTRAVWELLQQAGKRIHTVLKEEPLEVLIAIGSSKDLEDFNTLKKLVEPNSDIRWTVKASEHAHPEREPIDLMRCPMIFVAEDELFHRNHDAKGVDTYDMWKTKWDTRHQFLDSSIWHRSVGFWPDPENFMNRFESLLKDMLETWEKGLYGTISAIESLEFQCRLLRNSYLAHLDEGHAPSVVPFRFHSETEMEIKADETRSRIQDYQWGCLLIDDYAYKGLRPLRGKKEKSDSPDKGESGIKDKTAEESAEEKGPKTEQKACSKIDLITSLIYKRKDKEEEKDGKSLIKILNNNEEDRNSDPENWVAEGASLVRKYPKADIIILDYLLGRDGSGRDRYGVELIDQIVNEENGSKTNDKKSLSACKPFLKHWIFPVAVFNDAFLGHLGDIEENRVRSAIALAKGADPVTTPGLFLFQFYSFMEAQQKDLRMTLPEVMEDMFQRSDTDITGNQRSILGDVFPQILESKTNLSVLYKALGSAKLSHEYDAQEGREWSIFSKSYLSHIDASRRLLGINSHIQNLAYFIAFGSIQDSGKIYHELWRLTDSLDNLNEGIIHAGFVDKGKKWIQHVRDYVQSLTYTS